MLRVLGWSFSNVKPGATHQQGGIHCKIWYSRAMFLTKIFSFVTLQYMYKLLCVLAIRGRDQYFINPDYSYYDKPTENFPSF